MDGEVVSQKEGEGICCGNSYLGSAMCHNGELME